MRGKALIILLGLAGLVFASIGTQAQTTPRDDPETYYYGVDYDDLTDEEKAHWATLGWNEKNWDADSPADYPETEWSNWTGLTAEQQDALRGLGYAATMWNDSRPRAPVENVEGFWNDLDWGDLSPAEQNLWGILGWNAENWDGSAAEPASEEKDWAELSDAERAAAGRLGYNQAIWDSN